MNSTITHAPTIERRRGPWGNVVEVSVGCTCGYSIACAVEHPYALPQVEAWALEQAAEHGLGLPEPGQQQP